MKTAILLTCAALILASLPGRAEVPPGSPEDLRAGFYLLHDVCDKESRVSLITIVKTTPKPMVDYVKRISQLAKESVATLDRLRDGDSSLRDARDPLPPFERATRKSIAAEKQHQLLFGTKGADFATTLLFTQIEAANYIVHLSQVWAARDPDADRDATMRRMSRQWLSIRNEGFRMLYAGR